ncbi:olfactory receptor 6N2-like [Aquarana catesbeiana]|uniref:olfactory receptor 6N2-like n=1 Tax=Aquarana catesbeiana TaxID=8400 RepID=UPI003CC9D568
MVVWTNRTITEFILVGFPTFYSYGPFLFVCLLTVYLFTIAGNIIICILVKVDSRLHSPMFIFISILSFLEIFYTAVTIPKMLLNLIVEKKSISVNGCLLQTYFFHALGSCESYLLTAMAYDRYLAICHPLHYSSIMTPNMTIKLVGTCFSLGFLCPITEVILISRLPFCDNNEIEHIFCDFPPLLNLACVDTSINVLADFVTNCFIILVTFSLVMISYVRIIVAIMKIKTSVGRSKAFSTCVSHLTVVLTFFTCIVFMYVRLTRSYSLNFDRALAVIYSVVTPILNPVIYSLRNKEIRLAFKNRMCQVRNLQS